MSCYHYYELSYFQYHIAPIQTISVRKIALHQNWRNRIMFRAFITWIVSAVTCRSERETRRDIFRWSTLETVSCLVQGTKLVLRFSVLIHGESMWEDGLCGRKALFCSHIEAGHWSAMFSWPCFCVSEHVVRIMYYEHMLKEAQKWEKQLTQENEESFQTMTAEMMAVECKGVRKRDTRLQNRK